MRSAEADGKVLGGAGGKKRPKKETRFQRDGAGENGSSGMKKICTTVPLWTQYIMENSIMSFGESFL